MNTLAHHPASDYTREQILDAANSRFQQYGYGKTTMAEIASDVSMSAANLYRYFQNKQDIGAGLALRCFAQKEALLRGVLRRPGLTAAQRLQEFILTLVRYIHGQCSNQPRIHELVEAVAAHRRDIVARKHEGERALIAEILAEGTRAGEFDIPDVVTTAETVLATLTLFNVPLFMQVYPLEIFEDKATQVAELLVHGLARR
jgi:AcrR family transcriptional regulator